MAAASAQVYLNGAFVPRSEAVLDLEDRGSMFADGVYEVVRFYNGRAFAMLEHLDRLRRSGEGIELMLPDTALKLDQASRELVERNGLRDARVYWQVTRGSAPRDHLFPVNVTPNVFAIAYPDRPLDRDGPPPKGSAIVTEDLRWHLCWIKSLMLLPNVLARREAQQAGADEAILHRDQVVTEGSATSVMMVRRGKLWTHPADQWILGSITRAAVLDLARQDNIIVHEERFTVDELREADELLLCGTTRHVTALVRLGDRMVGDGKPGPITTRLHRLLVDHITKRCGGE